MGKGRKLFGSGVSIDHNNENNLVRKSLTSTIWEFDYGKQE